MDQHRPCPGCGHLCGMENLFCPQCGRQLDTARPAQSLSAIAQEKGLWHPAAFEHFPSVIAHEYHRLHQLCLADKPYGAMLQIKDLMETVLKFEVIAAIAWGMSHHLADFEKVACQITTPAMSLGRWCALGGEVRRYFREHTTPALPSALWKPLQAILSAYEENKLVSWRNQHIGHGALGFSEDAAFQQDIRNKLTLFQKLFQKLDEPIGQQHLLCDQQPLMGHASARALPFTGEIAMALPDGQLFPLEPFIRMLGKLPGENDREYDIYFYDNQSERTRQSEMLSYPSGLRRHQQIGFFQELYEQNRRLGSLDRNAAVDAQFRTQEQDDALNQLALSSMEYAFVAPDFLTEWLDEQLCAADRGVFMLQMFRGTGKSTFAEMLSCLNANPLRLSDDLDVRTYHINRSQLISADDFEAAIESLWERAYQQPAWSSSAMNRIRDFRTQHGMSESQALLAFLGQCQQYTARMRHKQRIMLVIDGLDEITDEKLWPYLNLPQAMLPEGVYVLFTSRCTDQTEEGVSADVCRRILSLPATAHMEVDRKQEAYLAFLCKYIQSVHLYGLSDEDIQWLIRRADWRVLYLGMLCKLLESGLSLDELGSSENLAKVYLDTLTDRYGEKEAARLRELLCILCTFGESEALSLREIACLTWNRGVITGDLLGKLNDLAPLLKVQRGFVAGGRQYTGVNRYAFANGDLALAFRTLLPQAADVAQENICLSLDGIAAYLQDDETTSDISTSLLAAASLFVLFDQPKQQAMLSQHADVTARLIEAARILHYESDLLTLSRLERLLSGMLGHIAPDLWQERAQISQTLAQLYALLGRSYQAVHLLEAEENQLCASASSETAALPYQAELSLTRARLMLDMGENVARARALVQTVCSRLQYAMKRGLPSNAATLADGYLTMAEIETKLLTDSSLSSENTDWKDILSFEVRIGGKWHVQLRVVLYFYHQCLHCLKKAGIGDAQKLVVLYERIGDLTNAFGIKKLFRLPYKLSAMRMYRNADALLLSSYPQDKVRLWSLRLKQKICLYSTNIPFSRKKRIAMQRDVLAQYEALDRSNRLPNRLLLGEACVTLAGLGVKAQEQYELYQRAMAIMEEVRQEQSLTLRETEIYLKLCLSFLNEDEGQKQYDLMLAKTEVDTHLYEESMSTGFHTQERAKILLGDHQWLRNVHRQMKDKAKERENQKAASELQEIASGEKTVAVTPLLEHNFSGACLVLATFLVLFFIRAPENVLQNEGYGLWKAVLAALPFAASWLVNIFLSTFSCVKQNRSGEDKGFFHCLWRDTTLMRRIGMRHSTGLLLFLLQMALVKPLHQTVLTVMSSKNLKAAVDALFPNLLNHTLETLTPVITSVSPADLEQVLVVTIGILLVAASISLAAFVLSLFAKLTSRLSILWRFLLLRFRLWRYGASLRKRMDTQGDNRPVHTKRT